MTKNFLSRQHYQLALAMLRERCRLSHGLAIYDEGWTDASMSDHITSRLNVPCTPHIVGAMRRDHIGHMKVAARAAARRDPTETPPSLVYASPGAHAGADARGNIPQDFTPTLWDRLYIWLFGPSLAVRLETHRRTCQDGLASRIEALENKIQAWENGDLGAALAIIRETAPDGASTASAAREEGGFPE